MYQFTSKEQFRIDFPQVAEMVDITREYFGDGCKLTYAKEGGNEIGTPKPDKGEPWQNSIPLSLSPAPKTVWK